MDIEKEMWSNCLINNTTGENLPTNEINIYKAILICKQAIKDACDKQKEIYADKYGVNCPDCDNVGWYGTPINKQRAIQISDNPDEYEVENYQELEQRQCEFCYVQPNSKFNILNAPYPEGVE